MPGKNDKTVTIRPIGVKPGGSLFFEKNKFIRYGKKKN